MKAAFTHRNKKTGGENSIRFCRLGHRPQLECATCQVIKKALKLAKIKTAKALVKTKFFP